MPAADFIEKYRNEELFQGCCKACPEYGNRWGCPPYTDDPQPDLAQYKIVKIYVVKVYPECSNVEMKHARELITDVRRQIEPQLLELEEKTGGRAAVFTGRCPHCPDDACTRREGKPCRHPELVRPSLEALGFDLCNSVVDLFNIKMQWGKDGFLPEYLTLVGGLFM